ncbi:AAA family ATPase [Streptomyces sp. NPDC093970]|uniref:AAA family ATPase n=1 Tax=Streptomyces sp. NPDC093970 TaxID=3155076 RepID=UPI00341B5ED7
MRLLLGDDAEPDTSRVVLVCGEPGAGRTALLRSAAERLRSNGLRVHWLDCLPGDAEVPLLLATRIAATSADGAGLTGITGITSEATVRRAPVQPATESVQSATGPDRTTGAALAEALRRPGSAVLVDDVHHADPESIALLRSLLPTFDGPSARLLLSVGTGPGGVPADVVGPAAPEFALLAGYRMVRSVALDPLTEAEVGELLTRQLEAVPDDALVAEAYRLGRGNPSAVGALLTALREAGGVRVVDGHAFRVDLVPVPVLPDDDRFVRRLRSLGTSCWTVAGAMSLLGPLGPAAPALAAAGTGLTGDTVDKALAMLVRAGVLDRFARPDGVVSWAFRIPLVAVAMRERLGPWQRRRISALAVETLWADEPPPCEPRSAAAVTDAADGTCTPPDSPGTPSTDTAPDEYGAAHEPAAAGTDHSGPRALAAPACAASWPGRTGAGRPPMSDAPVADIHETYLPERVADAGKSVDRRRAAATLLSAVTRIGSSYKHQAPRWVQAAARLSDTPAEQVGLLARYAGLSNERGDYVAAADTAERVLHSGGLRIGHEAALLLTAVHVTGLARCGDTERLERVAGSQWGVLLAPVVQTVSRAFALTMLGRWAEQRDLLERTRAQWQAEPMAEYFAAIFLNTAKLVLGEPQEFLASLDTPHAASLPYTHLYELTANQAGLLCGYGDPVRARAVIRRRSLDVELMHPDNRFLLHCLEGDWDEAVRVARIAVANGQSTTRPPIGTIMLARVSTVLLGRGRPTQAARVLETGRTPPNLLPYLLDHAQAAVHRVLGEAGLAMRTLRRGLDRAGESGSVFGTEDLWADLVAAEAEAGDLPAASAALAALAGVADAMGGERGRLLLLLAAARVPEEHREPCGLPDTGAVLHEAVELARFRAQPFETATTLLAVASAGLDPGPLLREAYELFGELDAGLWRFRVRTAMRASGVPVPGRGVATEENDRLLAELVAEALTNRQLSAVLGVSESAVANRLMRLFARTGTRSRLELATAVLGGRR